MKTFEYNIVSVNHSNRTYTSTPAFATVIDSFTGHFDGKEYWTLRIEKPYTDAVGEVAEIVEIETKEKSFFELYLRVNENDLEFALENNFEKLF